MSEAAEFVYRGRNTVHKNTFGPGRGADAGFFVRKCNAQSVVDKYNRWDRQQGRPESYEVVTYKVTEIHNEIQAIRSRTETITEENK